MATYYVYADEAARQAAIQAGEAAENNSFISIQTAINQSADGDTIQVGAGTFGEKIMVDKAVTLQGGGRAHRHNYQWPRNSGRRCYHRRFHHSACDC